MNDLDQARTDAQTWVPVAFFSFLEKPGQPPELCQLWASVLGQTEWRPVATRNLEGMQRAYAECQVFDAGATTEDS
jgi:hypothetical protein